MSAVNPEQFGGAAGVLARRPWPQRDKTRKLRDYPSATSTDLVCSRSMGSPMKIVLASESQFRRRAMDMVGVPYETRPARSMKRPSATMIPRN